LALIKPTLTYDGFEDVDIVAEAAFEGMALKKQIFAELDKICKPTTILATIRRPEYRRNCVRNVQA